MGSKTPQAPPTQSNPGERRITVTEVQLAAAFTEWDRRYREEPERFQSEAVHLLKETPETYGQACAPYLIALVTGEI